MKKFAAIVLGFTFLVSGFLMTDAQALMALSQIENQFSGDGNGLVIRIHKPCHENCLKDKNWHKHGGMNCRRISCPSGQNRSQPSPVQPDSSFINQTPLPPTEKVQQQNH